MNLGSTVRVTAPSLASPLSRRHSRQRVAGLALALPAKSSRFSAMGSRGLVELVPPIKFSSRASQFICGGMPETCRGGRCARRGLKFFRRAVMSCRRAVLSGCRGVIFSCGGKLSPCRGALNSCRGMLFFCRVDLFSTVYAKSDGFTAEYAKYAKGNPAPVAIRKDFAYLAWFAVQCFHPVFPSPTPICQLLSPNFI